MVVHTRTTVVATTVIGVIVCILPESITPDVKVNTTIPNKSSMKIINLNIAIFILITFYLIMINLAVFRDKLLQHDFIYFKTLN